MMGGFLELVWVSQGIVSPGVSGLSGDSIGEETQGFVVYLGEHPKFDEIDPSLPSLAFGDK